MSHADNRFDELHGLITAFHEDRLSDADAQRLEAWLSESAEARCLYLEYTHDSAGLHWLAHERAGEAEVVEPARRLPWWPMAAAAMLALAVWAGFARWGGAEQRPMFTDAPAVAVLSRVADVQWEGHAFNEGDPLPAGVLRLKSGLAQIEFYSGATVVLEGPAELELIDAQRGFCRSGRMRATVPPQAQGFTIRAPGMDVVDLGTEFGLSVGADGAEVHVFDGEVELHREGVQSLTTGKGVRIDAAGRRQAIGVDGASFADVAALAKRASADHLQRRRRWATHSEALRRDPSVVLYYGFEGQSSWDRMLRNGSGTSSLDGAIVGATWSEGRWPGKGALEFKRTSDRVRIDVPGEFDSMTFAAWVRFDGFDRWLSSLMLTDDFDHGEPHWQVSWDGEIILGVSGTGNHFSPRVLGHEDLGRWLHLATVYDRAARRVTHYLDGEAVGSNPILNPVRLRLGAAEVGNWNPVKARKNDKNLVRNLNGRLDEFVIFNRALGADRIRAIYEAGRPN